MAGRLQLKHNYARFFSDKQTARILAKSLRLIFAIPDTDDAWDQIARNAATNCDPAEQGGDQVEKTALEIMNPSEEEFEAGEKAVQDLVSHLKRMRAAGTTQRVPDGDGEWVITAEWRSNGKAH